MEARPIINTVTEIVDGSNVVVRVRLPWLCHVWQIVGCFDHATMYSTYGEKVMSYE